MSPEYCEDCQVARVSRKRRLALSGISLAISYALVGLWTWYAAGLIP